MLMESRDKYMRQRLRPHGRSGLKLLGLFIT